MTVSVPAACFSGMQPTGNLHLGNYLGAIKQLGSDMQDSHECIYCVVDLHADHRCGMEPEGTAPRNTRDVTAAYIACGIDPKKQHHLQPEPGAEHAELAWVSIASPAWAGSTA